MAKEHLIPSELKVKITFRPFNVFFILLDPLSEVMLNLHLLKNETNQYNC